MSVLRIGSLGLYALSLVLSGCITDVPVPAAAADGIVLSIDPTLPLVDQAHFWEGKSLRAEKRASPYGPFPGNMVAAYRCSLAGTCPSWKPPSCNSGNCERVDFRLDLPDGFWATREGNLEVSVRHIDVGDTWRSLMIVVRDEAGKEVATGWDGGEGAVALVPQAASGAYSAQIIMDYGEGTYDAMIQVDAVEKDRPTHALLPNLITLPPTDVFIGDNSRMTSCVFLACAPREASAAAAGVLGVKGCYVADEAVEQGARRCLRFANRVGNAGEGPLEMRLTGVEAAKAVAGQGKHVQRIHNSDGTYTDREAGVANYHTTHEHFHFMNLVEFRLHKYDAVSDTRGERIGGAYKTGICLMDIGLIALGMPHTSLPNWDVTCFYAGAQQEWNMSLSPNWFDLYGAYNHENYVDITNVPDGVYELVATSNVDGRVAESDVTDNEGSVVIQLKGNQVSVLKERKGSEWAAASP